MGPREFTQEGIGVRAFPQREGGKVQAHRPPLRPALQRDNRLRTQVQAPHLLQQGRRFLKGESQVGGP